MRQKICGRGKVGLLQVLFVLAAFPVCCIAQTVWLRGVEITPGFPTIFDEITISVMGEAGGYTSYVSSSQFYQNQNELMLDLYVTGGDNYTALSVWEYDEPIGVLSPDFYTLTVYAYDNSDSTLQDEYTINFTVTPEPCTLLLFGTGLLTIRSFSRKKLISN
jgi:hypothetical protein